MKHPKKILKALGASPQRQFSQNFLTSPHWAEKLTAGVLSELPKDWGGEIWEIGPGLGALTEVLLNAVHCPLRVFEIDRKLLEYLAEQHPRLLIEPGDVTRSQWERLFAEAGKVRILSNLPYHISSKILLQLIEFKSSLERLIVTFQKEYAERLLAKPRTPSYGSLSVLIQTHFEIKHLGILPPGAFFPKPEIDSTALLFVPKTDPLPEGFQVLLRAAFSQRRKKLGNNLKRGFDRSQLEEALKPLGKDLHCRAEELSPSDFVALAEALQATGK